MEAVGGVLGRVMQGLGLGTALRGWQAVEAWPRVVGPRVSRHTRAVSFRDGTLNVEVEGSAWMHELGFLKRQLVGKVNEHLGDEVVRELRFSIFRGGSLR
jgi:predicted nucleic acid-binding Zn ribbon protein